MQLFGPFKTTCMVDVTIKPLNLVTINLNKREDSTIMHPLITKLCEADIAALANLLDTELWLKMPKF